MDPTAVANATDALAVSLGYAKELAALIGVAAALAPWLPKPSGDPHSFYASFISAVNFFAHNFRNAANQP